MDMDISEQQQNPCTRLFNLTPYIVDFCGIKLLHYEDSEYIFWLREGLDVLKILRLNTDLGEYEERLNMVIWSDKSNGRERALAEVRQSFLDYWESWFPVISESEEYPK